MLKDLDTEYLGTFRTATPPPITPIPHLIPSSRPADVTNGGGLRPRVMGDGSVYGCDVPLRESYNVGTLLAHRIRELGLKEVLAIPGDYNLTLLDQLISPSLQLIGCCNELNMGYAADGYARAYGVAVVVVTESVGGLSVANAIAGAFAENLAVVCISGAAHTHDYASDHLLHHSTNQKNKDQCLRIFEQITAKAVRIDKAHSADSIIVDAFQTALRMRKPVYIEICCNMSTAPVPPPTPMMLYPAPVSDELGITAAVTAITAAFSTANSPVLLFGPRAYSWGRSLTTASPKGDPFSQSLERLATAAGCGHAVQLIGKGKMDETAPGYMGVYFGEVSYRGCRGAMEEADLVLAVGAQWDELSTVGYAIPLANGRQKVLDIDAERGVKMPNGQMHRISNFPELIKRLTDSLAPIPNSTTFDRYLSLNLPTTVPQAPLPDNPAAALTRTAIIKTLQGFIKPQHTLMTDAGDSWFNAGEVDLPSGAGFEGQLCYASIGWGLPAAMGYSLASRHSSRRPILLIGDGALQMTIQELSTIIRYRLNPIIILVNNFGYQIEEVLHAGPYNLVSNWSYAEMVKCFVSGTDGVSGRGVVGRVCLTEGELGEGLKDAEGAEGRERLCFLECRIRPEDVSERLVKFGAAMGRWGRRETGEWRSFAV